MANDHLSMNTRIRLSVMMFLQYAIHAVWIVPLSQYLGKTLDFTGTQIHWVGSTAAIGCLVAPIFVGMIADRFFASQRMLGLLNLVGAGLLFWASTITDPWKLVAVLLLQQLCYMPTWAITNSIAMANCKDMEKDFPQIRVMGSIGWAVVGIFSLIATLAGKGWDATHLPILTAGIFSAVAGVFAFALPHTAPPAAGKKTSLADVLCLKALALMKTPSFAILILVSAFVMIPFAAYWTFCARFLGSLGVQAITFTMSFGQYAEIFFVLLIPILLKRLGVKWMLVLGVAALSLRYVMFMFGGETMMFPVYGGIIVHGLIFGFFFVVGQIYVAQIAPKEIRAQGQGLIMLVSFGAGLLLGNYIGGRILDANEISGEPVAKTYKIPGDIAASPTLTIDGAKIFDSVAYNRDLNGMEIEVLNAQQQNKPILVARLKKEYGDKVKLDQGKITNAVKGDKLTFSIWLELLEDKNELTGTVYSIGTGDQALELGLDKGRLTFRAGKAKITQVNPLATGDKVHIAGTFDGEKLKLYAGGKPYRRFEWQRIWLWPAIISGVLVVVLIVLFHPPAVKKEDEEPAAEEAAGEPAAASAAPADETPADEPPAEE